MIPRSFPSFGISPKLGPSSSQIEIEMSPVVPLLIEASALGRSNILQEILAMDYALEDFCGLDSRTDSPSYGLTALHRAKNEEIAKILLDFGFNVNIKGIQGQTPMHTCCDNPSILQLLIERNGTIDALTNDYSTPLEWAVIADNLSSAQLLLDKGADVNHANAIGNTPLHMVTSRKMTELLLLRGAKVSNENIMGQIPLETAAERQGEPEYASIAELLLDVSTELGLKNRILNEPKKQLSNSQLIHPTTGEDERTNKSKWDVVRKAFLNKEGKQKSNKNVTPLVATEWTPLINQRGTSGQSSYSNFNRATSVESNASSVNNNNNNNNKKVESVGEIEEEAQGGENTNNSQSGPKFYDHFFENCIKQKPFLAIKMLSNHKTFLYAKGTSKVYSYDLSLLGNVEASNRALRLICDHDRRDIVTNDLVQFLISAKWHVSTKKRLWYEVYFYVLFLVCFFFFFFLCNR
jgi:ankyrin repeat protein